MATKEVKVEAVHLLKSSQTSQPALPANGQWQTAPRYLSGAWIESRTGSRCLSRERSSDALGDFRACQRNVVVPGGASEHVSNPTDVPGAMPVSVSGFSASRHRPVSQRKSRKRQTCSRNPTPVPGPSPGLWQPPSSHGLTGSGMARGTHARGA